MRKLNITIIVFKMLTKDSKGCQPIDSCQFMAAFPFLHSLVFLVNYYWQMVTGSSWEFECFNRESWVMESFSVEVNSFRIKLFKLTSSDWFEHICFFINLFNYKILRLYVFIDIFEKGRFDFKNIIFGLYKFNFE